MRNGDGWLAQHPDIHNGAVLPSFGYIISNEDDWTVSSSDRLSIPS